MTRISALAAASLAGLLVGGAALAGAMEGDLASIEPVIRDHLVDALDERGYVARHRDSALKATIGSYLWDNRRYLGTCWLQQQTLGIATFSLWF